MKLAKSTLRQAIFHSLFTPTDLTPAKLRDVMSPWFPLPDGDHASVTVSIEHDGKHYHLQKMGFTSRIKSHNTRWFRHR